MSDRLKVNLHLNMADGRADRSCEITAYMHCGKCLAERPSEQSLREWGQLEVGFTHRGLQVWCKRHEINVISLSNDGADDHGKRLR